VAKDKGTLSELTYAFSRKEKTLSACLSPPIILEATDGFY
jgi:hypothetical protein